MQTALAIIFGTVFVGVLTFMAVLRWGMTYPRFGRRLDAKLYRASPRLGHWFVDDPDEGDEV
jgi:hypothetical protein